jgi:crotonobetainyl-CoA:carnitine CoA-transferase CaiB-like acyl-CoA transferase
MKNAALSGIRILDMSRVLAGPSCTQLLGDFGADVIKVERRGVGDETRTWGPPFMKGSDGNDTSESAYYLSANRNKRSVEVDIAKPEGVELVKRMLKSSDVFIENFKVGGLKKYGLSYEDLREEFPNLIYCSITGYGQTGPYADRPGYDMMAQGIGGLISMTGEPDRAPVKVPIAINDIMTGMNAAVSILAAMRHRDNGGAGQHIDLSLLDTQVGWLFNQGTNYLVGGNVPERLGTAHPNSVPYQAFETADGFVIIAVNNDGQFERFCKLADREDLLDHPKFKTNPDRVRNRNEVVAEVAEIMKTRTSAEWIDGLSAANIGVCPINDVEHVFSDPQVEARSMKINMRHSKAGDDGVDLIASSIKMSVTGPEYRRPPPSLGEHTDEVLVEVFGLSSEEISELRASEVI